MLGGADPVRVDRPSRASGPPRRASGGGTSPQPSSPSRRRRRTPPASVRDDAERATIPIICADRRAQSSRACSSEISFSFPSFQAPARRAVSAWRSAGARSPSGSTARTAPGRASSSSGRCRRGAPDVLVGVVPDELLDVDAAVPERAASRSGSAISVSTATTPSRPGLKSFIGLESTRLLRGARRGNHHTVPPHLLVRFADRRLAAPDTVRPREWLTA